MAKPGNESQPEAGETIVVGGPEATALAAALGGGARAGKLAPEAAELLTSQRRLADVQLEHLLADRELQNRHFRLKFFGDRLRIGLQVLAILFGLVVVSGLGAMAWQAHEDHGLVVDAFSVPPDIARDGLTGQVVAARFLDKLQAMQTATQSDRPASSFQNNWGSDIKVEIPDTGLTFGELEKLLRDRLGHTSHVTGEVIRTPAGIALTARLGDAPPQTFTGDVGRIDDVAQQAAEAIYRSSQPYRFAQYLEQHGRMAEAFTVIADLAAHGPASERGWAYSLWSTFDLNDHGDPVAARVHGLKALAQGGGAMVETEIALVGEEAWSGHDEASLRYSIDLERRAQTRAPEQTEDYFNENRLVASAWLKSLVGDERGSAVLWPAVEKEADVNGIQGLSPGLAAMAYALDHDLPAARAAIAAKEEPDDTRFLEADAVNQFSALPTYWIAAESGDWSAALADARAADAWLAERKPTRPLMGLLQSVWIHPLEALALAKTGDAAGASALIATTPLDCYLCLRVRGRIATEARDWPAADRWFAEAAQQAPSLPFAETEWGASLLARGDADAAIVKLSRAHKAGPHFADPQELWGEALLKKGDLKGAVAKFQAADADAPRWGRNHLLWGEALARLGRTDDAKAQRRQAAASGLSVNDGKVARPGA
jgi:tetratricopeptide (TPR) repeat protein